MSFDSEIGLKPYSAPSFTKLTVEQATQFLAIHAGSGNQEAINMLELLREEFNERQRFLGSD